MKDERHYDRFDRVFAEIFNGAQKMFDEIVTNVPPEWLQAMAARATMGSLAEAIYAFPTFAQGVRGAAREWLNARQRLQPSG